MLEIASAAANSKARMMTTTQYTQLLGTCPEWMQLIPMIRLSGSRLYAIRGVHIHSMGNNPINEIEDH
jgi:hypothetical protein